LTIDELRFALMVWDIGGTVFLVHGATLNIEATFRRDSLLIRWVSPPIDLANLSLPQLEALERQCMLCGPPPTKSRYDLLLMDDFLE
jgi:hypothetical protein